MPSRARAIQLARNLLPWLVGTAIVVVVALRVPIDAFRAGLGTGPHVKLALVDLALTVSMLVSDSFATWIGLSTVGIRLPFGKTIALRGATYIVSLINYAVGQGSLGFYLHRSGIPAIRAASATLFLIGTTFATLLLLTLVAWGASGHAANPTLWSTLVIGGALFAVYLAIIAIAPRAIARVGLLASLFDAKLRGHAIAIAARLPHVIVIVFTHWVAMRVWGIPVPFERAATLMQAVVIAAVLPISPAGFGTTQAALVYLFADYAIASTADERSAFVLAFSVVHFAYCVIAQLAIGLVSIPFAKRATEALPTAQPVGPD